MIKMLIGGSPCTKWSIAQKSDRETQPKGLGWELFKNYLIALQKFKPDYFLYENNKSAAQPIKDRISAELGVELMYINSGLLSGQNRERFYGFNWDVLYPKDRGILLKDVLEGGNYETTIEQRGAGLTVACEPLYIGELPEHNGTYYNGKQPSQQYRIFDTNGKAVAVTTCAITNVAEPVMVGSDGRFPTKAISRADGNTYKVYEVKDGRVVNIGKDHPIKLADGHYIFRKLTVTECCRLQTLPDDYCKVVSPSQAYKGLGNGWTAEVILHILNGVLKDVPRDEEIVVLSMYDGIGTGRYCLDKLGFTNVKYYAYEIDKFAIQVAKSNYPDIIEMGDAFALRDPNWFI